MRVVALSALSKRRLLKRMARFPDYGVMRYEERPLLLFLTLYSVVLERRSPRQCAQIELSVGPFRDN